LPIEGSIKKRAALETTNDVFEEGKRLNDCLPHRDLEKIKSEMSLGRVVGKRSRGGEHRAKRVEKKRGYLPSTLKKWVLYRGEGGLEKN